MSVWSKVGARRESRDMQTHTPVSNTTGHLPPSPPLSWSKTEHALSVLPPLAAQIPDEVCIHVKAEEIHPIPSSSENTHTLLHTSLVVCVCVCIWDSRLERPSILPHTPASFGPFRYNAEHTRHCAHWRVRHTHHNPGRRRVTVVAAPSTQCQQRARESWIRGKLIRCYYHSDHTSLIAEARLDDRASISAVKSAAAGAPRAVDSDSILCMALPFTTTGHDLGKSASGCRNRTVQYCIDRYQYCEILPVKKFNSKYHLAPTNTHITDHHASIPSPCEDKQVTAASVMEGPRRC